MSSKITLIKKKQSNYLLKIDELLEKQFKNFLFNYFNK